MKYYLIPEEGTYLPPLGDGLSSAGRQANNSSQETLLRRVIKKMAGLLLGVGRGWSVLNEETW